MIIHSVLFESFEVFIWLGPITMVTLQKKKKQSDFGDLIANISSDIGTSLLNLLIH